MIKSKKGFNTIITIASVLALILVFIIFIYLFSWGAKRKEGEIDSKFSSVESEYVLKTFLRSPSPILGKTPVNDITPDIGGSPTNADLISWTCNADKKGINYKTLAESINTHFDKLYGDHWEAWIIYSNTDLDRRAFGHGSWLEKIRLGLMGSKVSGWEGIAEPFPVSGGENTGSTTNDERRTALAQALAGSYKEKGFGFQIVPCQDGTFSAVMLKAEVLVLKPYAK